MRLALLALLLLSATPLATAQPLRVVAASPTPNAVSAARETPIVIDFSAPVDPGTFDHTTVMVFGRWSGVAAGAMAFEEGGTRVRFVPARPFSAGERVTVSLARRLADDGGATMERGFAWQFWTRPRPASLDLRLAARRSVRRPGEGWIQTYGAYAGDLDGDGYTDFAVPNERVNDVRVFMNDGEGAFGNFRAYPLPNGDRPSTNEGADFNLDGHLDFAVGSSRNAWLHVFLGDGQGGLIGPDNYATEQGVRGLAVLDLDGDGFPDLATASRDAGTVSLLLNRGDGTFSLSRVFDPGGIGETAAAVADANEDGLLDLFVGALESREIILLLADGQGGLHVHTKVPAGGTPWMLATGDVDGDGHADVVSANAESDNASVLLGDGRGALSDPVTYPTGAFALAIDLGDLDGDGDLDLVTSNFGSATWTIFENDGDGGFGTPRTLPAERAGSCAVLHDRDNDGALDLTGIDELSDELFLFANDPVSTHAEPPAPPPAFALRPAYPNPFAGQTTIPFRLEAPAAVSLAVYDVLGRRVRTLREGLHAPGEHRAAWNGRDDAGRRLAAGAYFVRLETDGRSRTLPVRLLQPAP